MNDAAKNQIQGLSTLLQLQARAREAEDLAALQFVMVNETRSLFEYHQAVLVSEDHQVLAISGVPELDRNAPYVQWLKRSLKQLPPAQQTQALQRDSLPEPLAAGAEQWWPSSLLMVPLKQAVPMGYMLLMRESEWPTHEQVLLDSLMSAYAHAWGCLGGYKSKRNKRSYGAWLLLLAALAGAQWPVNISVLAPAEVVAQNPTVIRSPLEGVVDTLKVSPNAAVVPGQTLFTLDDTLIRNQIEVASKALSAVEIEYRQVAQQALVNQDSKLRVSLLEVQKDIKQTELAYQQSLLARTQVPAPQAGVVVLNDVNEWIGRPVALGERVLAIADPDHVELELRLAAADAIRLSPDAKVALFLNVSPDRAIKARLSYIAYQAEVDVDGSLIYRLKAQFDDDSPRLGLTGTARIEGEEVRLWYYLLRRPLAAMRQWLGW